jgi:predicted HTH transcriptional regulator
MYLAGYVERAGTGTEDIINKCREWGLLAPVWKDDGENDGEKNSAIKGLSDKEKIVFSVIKTDPYTTTAFLAKSKKLTRPTIERAIKKLKQLGLIKRIGPDKGGHWEVK